MMIQGKLKAVARWMKALISGPAVIELVTDSDSTREFLVWIGGRACDALNAPEIPRCLSECPDRGYVVSVQAKLISEGLFGVTVTYQLEEVLDGKAAVPDVLDRQEQHSDSDRSGFTSVKYSDAKQQQGVHPETTVPHEG